LGGADGEGGSEDADADAEVQGVVYAAGHRMTSTTRPA
jgi:hypothetical protein